MLFVATEVGVLSPESSNSLLNKLYFFRPLDLSYLYSHRDLHDWLSFGQCGSMVLGAFKKPNYSTSKQGSDAVLLHNLEQIDYGRSKNLCTLLPPCSATYTLPSLSTAMPWGNSNWPG